MGVFPLVAAAVAAAFSIVLFRRYRTRPRAYLALWSVAMAMYAVASLALFAGASRPSGWHQFTWFRLFWLFGAVLNVPFLAGGEACLLFRSSRTVPTVLSVLGILSMIATVVVFMADGRVDACCGTGYPELPSGTAVWAAARAPLVLARAYSYVAYALLLAGTLWSVTAMRGVPALRARFQGTLLVAVGATIVAGGSAFAVKGMLAGFSLALAAGVTIMFLGFLRASSDASAQPAADRPEVASVHEG